LIGQKAKNLREACSEDLDSNGLRTVDGLADRLQVAACQNLEHDQMVAVLVGHHHELVVEVEVAREVAPTGNEARRGEPCARLLHAKHGQRVVTSVRHVQRALVATQPDFRNQVGVLKGICRVFELETTNARRTLNVSGRLLSDCFRTSSPVAGSTLYT